jgi:hypothetical protein
MNKKSQLQIMENVFVMLIIFIILVIAFVFVMVMQKSEQKDKLEEYKELELIKKAQVLNFLPEMQCSDNNNLDPDCYDILKIKTFKKYLETDQLYYRSMLGYIKIVVTRYDPSPDINKEIESWEIYDNKPEEYNGEMPLQFPVLLKDVTENSNYFGIIKLTLYS